MLFQNFDVFFNGDLYPLVSFIQASNLRPVEPWIFCPKVREYRLLTMNDVNVSSGRFLRFIFTFRQFGCFPKLFKTKYKLAIRERMFRKHRRTLNRRELRKFFTPRQLDLHTRLQTQWFSIKQFKSWLEMLFPKLKFWNSLKKGMLNEKWHKKLPFLIVTRCSISDE